jgi:hypothetical protein
MYTLAPQEKQMVPTLELDQLKNKELTLLEFAKICNTENKLIEWQERLDWDKQNRPKIITSGRHSHITVGRLISRLSGEFFKIGTQGSGTKVCIEKPPSADMWHIPAVHNKKFTEDKEFFKKYPNKSSYGKEMQSLSQHKTTQKQFKKEWKQREAQHLALKKELPRIEMKAISKNEEYARVGKSKYFAKNSSTGKLKDFLKEHPTEGEIKEWIIKNNYSEDDYWILPTTSDWDGDIENTIIYIVDRDTLINCLSYNHNIQQPFCFVEMKKIKEACSPFFKDEQNKVA